MEPGESDVEHEIFGNMMGDEVVRALESLPALFRIAVYLADVEELSYEEISEIMETPVGTVRSRIARGRKMLQVKLRQYAVEAGYIKDKE